MLTKKQNFLETINGGKPDRFVNQFEFIGLSFADPMTMTSSYPLFPGDEDKTDLWGITWTWPEHTPGAFPKHDCEHKVIKDIKTWKEVVKAPSLDFPEDLWETAKQDYAKFDRNEVFVGPLVSPGLFELTHCLMGMEDALMSFYEEPEAMHELINYITDWQIAYMKQITDILHPDIVFQHDDWGSSLSTFLSVEMFKEFYLESYKKLYKSYKDNGVEIIVHHSDSFAASYVPFMIEMGIDVWQGGTKNNNIPELIKKYGGKISFMTGIESSEVDKLDWSPQDIEKAVHRACETCGKLYFIPNTTVGGPMSVYSGVYEAVSEAIDKMSNL